MHLVLVKKREGNNITRDPSLSYPEIKKNHNPIKTGFVLVV